MECTFLHKTSQILLMEMKVFARLLPTALCVDTMVHVARKINGFAITYYLQLRRKETSFVIQSHPILCFLRASIIFSTMIPEQKNKQKKQTTKY